MQSPLLFHFIPSAGPLGEKWKCACVRCNLMKILRFFSSIKKQVLKAKALERGLLEESISTSHCSVRAPPPTKFAAVDLFLLIMHLREIYSIAASEVCFLYLSGKFCDSKLR
jgi:hypothetical protein